MSKEIDIDNEEEILKECSFDYFYNCDDCSRELCMFYNDILKQKEPEFDKRQALIDLMRIAITINKKTKRIVEMGVEIDEWIAVRDDKNKVINKQTEKIKELKQQLAEKEKEISNLRGLVNERDKQIKNLKTNKKRVIEHKNNVKISFCIEQLEKVKEKALHFYVNDTPKLTGFYIDVNEIDNQIKQLKEMK